MPFLALAIALLLAGPVYGGDCSGTAPNDVCEAGRPALTASGMTSSGKTADGSGTTGRSKPSPTCAMRLPSCRGVIRARCWRGGPPSGASTTGCPTFRPPA